MDSSVFINKIFLKTICYPNNNLFDFVDFDNEDNPYPWEEDMEEIESSPKSKILNL